MEKDVRSMSIEELRQATLSGNEAALDELLRRKRLEIEEAVIQAQYEQFMKERTEFSKMVQRCGHSFP